MNRLFLKVYVGIAIVLTLGTLGTLLILSRGLDAARQRSFEERLIDSADFIRARVQADNLFHEEEDLWRLSRAARMPFEIKRQSEIPDDVHERLSRNGETFVHEGLDGRLRVYSVFIDGKVLVGRFGGRDGRRGFDGFRSGGPDRFRPEWRGREGRGSDRNWFGQGPPPLSGPGGEGWNQTRKLFLLSVIGIPILLVGPAIYFLIRPLDRRINAFSRVAERFGEGDLDSRAEADKSDAFGQLSGSFNRMADQIKSLIDGQNELLRAVSHELRTPLARLFFMLDDAEDAPTKSEQDKHLGRIQRTLTDINDLVEELLTYVRMDRDAETALERVGVRGVLEETREVAHDLRDDISIHVFCGEVMITAVPRLLKRAILNLVTNATRHARTRVWVRVWKEDDFVHLAVDDDGPGVPIDQRSKILEPFSRVDESRSSRIGGAGLGLAIVTRVVALHDGTISVEESPAGGARFLLSFPAERSFKNLIVS